MQPRHPLLSSATAAALFATTAIVTGAASVPAAYAAAPRMYNPAGYSCTTNYYVDGTNGNDANPGTQALPWKSISNADNGYPNTPKPGECVNVLPGTYNLSKTLILAHGGDMNLSDHYVVYRSTVRHGAHLVAAPGITSGANGDMIMLWGAYLIIDGFDIDGKGITSGHGIDGCANGGQPGNISHHFVAIHNVIHDMGGSGLSSCSAEYITWQYNVIYNTSATNPYQVSGVNIWKPKALVAGSFTRTARDNVEYGIDITSNRIYNNGEGPAIPAPHTDGNGIIIDTTLGSASCATCGTPYPGKILVSKNTIFGNGGRGVHLFLSENVTVANNTVYNNNLDITNPSPNRGELTSAGSQGVLWLNNIGIAVPGQGVLASCKPAVTYAIANFPDTGTWTNNITFGAPPNSDSTSYVNPATNKIGVNPDLADPAASKFTPLPGSPAIGSGLPEPYLHQIPPDIGSH